MILRPGSDHIANQPGAHDRACELVRFLYPEQHADSDRIYPPITEREQLHFKKTAAEWRSFGHQLFFGAVDRAATRR
jgi:hypothetical protein